MSFFRGKDAQRLGPPPVGTPPAMVKWLNELVEVVNRTPRFSYFSAASPESIVTALPGDLAINIGSASTDSRLWVKGGSGTVPTATGWRVVRVL